MITPTDPFPTHTKDSGLDVVHALDGVVHLTLNQYTDPVHPFQALKDPPQGWPLRTGSEISSIFIIRPTAQQYGVLVIISWIIVGETERDGKTNPVTIGVLMVWHQQNGDWTLLARQAVRREEPRTNCVKPFML